MPFQEDTPFGAPPSEPDETQGGTIPESVIELFKEQHDHLRRLPLSSFTARNGHDMGTYIIMVDRLLRERENLKSQCSDMLMSLTSMAADSDLNDETLKKFLRFAASVLSGCNEYSDETSKVLLEKARLTGIVGMTTMPFDVRSRLLIGKSVRSVPMPLLENAIKHGVE